MLVVASPTVRPGAHVRSPAFAVAASGERLGAVARRDLEAVVFVRVAMVGSLDINVQSGSSQSELGWGAEARGRQCGGEKRRNVASAAAPSESAV